VHSSSETLLSASSPEAMLSLVACVCDLWLEFGQLAPPDITHKAD